MVGRAENPQQMRIGIVTLTALETSKVVTFDEPMLDDNYQIFFQPLSNVGVPFWVTNLTATEFTLHVTTGVAATFAYLAVQA